MQREHERTTITVNHHGARYQRRIRLFVVQHSSDTSDYQGMSNRSPLTDTLVAALVRMSTQALYS